MVRTFTTVIGQLGADGSITPVPNAGTVIITEKTSLIRRLIKLQETIDVSGQVATQYADLNGEPSMDITANPNGSMWAIEGITSPDGRVLGKMGHTERRGTNIARNVPGSKYQPLFKAGVRYFG